MARSRGGPTDDDRCAWCGEELGEDPVALAAVYVDEAGDELDADLAFCDEAHLQAWVAARTPSATSRYEDGDAPWRAGPARRRPSLDGPDAAGSGSGATAKAVAAIFGVLVLFVLAAWGLGRLLA